jgi:hypothetical protein
MLLYAILDRAIKDANGSTQIGADLDRQEQFKAKRWLKSESIKPFSFLWVCDLLEIEPKRIFRLVK